MMFNKNKYIELLLTGCFTLPDDQSARPLKDFVQHVAELHSSQGFQQEFEVKTQTFLYFCLQLIFKQLLFLCILSVCFLLTCQDVTLLCL